MSTVTGSDGISNPPGDVRSNSAPPPRLRLNHPKNYIGVPVAVMAPGDTGSLVMGNLTAMAGAAKLGARAFGLIDTDGEVTAWGKELLADILDGTNPETYLAELSVLRNSRGRFVEQRPEWEEVAEKVARQYVATEPVIELLQQEGPLKLPEMVSLLSEDHWDLVSHLFLKEGVADHPEEITNELLADSDSYRGAGVCQFKGTLYHFGVVTMPGSSTDYLDPSTGRWELAQKVGNNGGV